MTHTPGPWIYDDKYVQVLDDDDNEIYIAGICGPFTDWGRANAALIAAAPDLLDAAEAGLDAYWLMEYTAGLTASLSALSALLSLPS